MIEPKPFRDEYGYGYIRTHTIDGVSYSFLAYQELTIDGISSARFHEGRQTSQRRNIFDVFDDVRGGHDEYRFHPQKNLCVDCILVKHNHYYDESCKRKAHERVSDEIPRFL